MGPVGLVHQCHHSVGMGQVHDGFQVGADAVVGWIVDQDRLGIRILRHGGFYILQLHPQRDSELRVHLRIDVDRHCAAEHQGVDGAFVDIPGHDDLVAVLTCGEDHALDCACGSPHQKERVGCPEGVRRQIFRLPDHRDRMTQIVERLHGVHVDLHAFLTEEIHQLGIASSSLVPRHVKGNDPQPPEMFQCAVKRRILLLSDIHLFSCLMLPVRPAARISFPPARRHPHPGSEEV